MDLRIGAERRWDSSRWQHCGLERKFHTERVSVQGIRESGCGESEGIFGLHSRREGNRGEGHHVAGGRRQTCFVINI